MYFLQYDLEMKINHRCISPNSQLALKGFILMNSSEKANFYQRRCWKSRLKTTVALHLSFSQAVPWMPTPSCGSVQHTAETQANFAPDNYHQEQHRNTSLGTEPLTSPVFVTQPCRLIPEVPASRARRQCSSREPRATQIVWSGAHCPLPA